MVKRTQKQFDRADNVRDDRLSDSGERRGRGEPRDIRARANSRKVDTAAAVEFNAAAAANRNIQAVRAGMTILDVSAKSGGGMEGFLEFLRSRRAAARAAAASEGASDFAAHD